MCIGNLTVNSESPSTGIVRLTNHSILKNAVEYSHLASRSLKPMGLLLTRWYRVGWVYNKPKILILSTIFYLRSQYCNSEVIAIISLSQADMVQGKYWCCLTQSRDAAQLHGGSQAGQMKSPWPGINPALLACPARVAFRCPIPCFYFLHGVPLFRPEKRHVCWKFVLTASIRVSSRIVPPFPPAW